MKRTFEMNGKSYNSMMDIARDLGVKRVYPKDFDKYGIKEVDDTELASDVDSMIEEQDASESQSVETVEDEVKSDEKIVAEAAEDDTESVSDENGDPVNRVEKTEKKSKEAKVVKEKVEKSPVAKKRLGTVEDIKLAEDGVGTMDIIQFNDTIKHFGVEALVKMAETAGIDTWESITNEPIRRMRLLMEIKSHYYPTDKTPVRPKSNWKKVNLEALVTLADEHKLEYKKSDEEQIQRMWVIFALNTAGLTPQDLKKSEPEEEETNA